MEGRASEPESCSGVAAGQVAPPEHESGRACDRTEHTMVSVATITDLKGLVHTHVPELSRRHPLIPKHYVMPWKQDMVNRKQILKNVELAQLHIGPHEESLFLENRERICHGEDRKRIEAKWKKQPPLQTIDFPLHSPLSRYKSSVINQRSRI